MRVRGGRVRHATFGSSPPVPGRRFARLRTNTTNAVPHHHHNTAAARSLIDNILPRSRFASSAFTTPLLLFFRLFYQATSFERYSAPSTGTVPRVTIRHLFVKVKNALKVSAASGRIPSESRSGHDDVVDISAKTSTDSWYNSLRSGRYAIGSSSTVLSMTWVKSLSAPLSHEYLQFVVECTETRQLYRLITERDTDGDWSYFIASSSQGRLEEANGVTQLRQYDYQHDLPLPLLSLSWSMLPRSRQPTLLQLAAACQAISKLCPEYNFMRQHCWWYAEKLFEHMLGQPPPGVSPRQSRIPEPRLKHWPWGVYRYSYIVLGKRLLRRDVLIEQARKFRKDMDKDGQLQW